MLLFQGGLVNKEQQPHRLQGQTGLCTVCMCFVPNWTFLLVIQGDNNTDMVLTAREAARAPK